ncbi:MAG: hypothetical protein MJ252_27205 [archaeon]|nr:hypothetical protein [archaeon]
MLENNPIVSNSVQEIIPNCPAGFNPLTHQPPKYDIYGVQKPQPYLPPNMRYNILAEKDKIRIPWENQGTNLSSPMTRTKLLEQRRKARIPDISYDLDGDGYVGGKDFVISKLYDLDGDGKLNEKEKKNALEGIKNGIENKYMWNLENQGGNRAYRILQRRGKIIDAEDFLPISETYPKHPLSLNQPKNGVKTKKDLDIFRKNQTIEEINQKIKRWETEHPNELQAEPLNYHSDYKPPFNSMQEKKDLNHRQCRLKCGLNEYESLIKENNPPSLEYIENPKHKTFRDIEADRHKENLEKGLLITSKAHKNDMQRLQEREDEIFSKLYQRENGKTYEDIKEKRKKETLEYNTKHFSVHPLGVHGHELPKFSENEGTKEFWKLRDGYLENPKFNSQVEFLEDIKYWKKREDLYINEHKDYDPEKDDPLKTKEYVKQEAKGENDVTGKVNKINFYKGFDPNVVKEPDLEKTSKQHIYRWTTLVNQFAPSKFKDGRFFDAIEENNKDAEEERMMEEMRKLKIEKELKEKEKAEQKEKTPEELGIFKQPLYQKLSSKMDIKLNKSTLVKSTAF